MSDPTRAGYVTLSGRPNVGKSTLLNKILKHKLCITSHKPQTTRHSILGIHTEGNHQLVLIDTPGMHNNQNNHLNRRMNRTAHAATADADVVLFLVEAGVWTDVDQHALDVVKQSGCKQIALVVNKIDQMGSMEELLPFLQEVGQLHDFSFVVPLSAKNGRNVQALLGEVFPRLPESEFIFAEDALTDKSERFLIAEIVREQLLRLLHKELPYTTSVEVEEFQYDEEGKLNLAVTIWVARKGQKAIVIGKGGTMLKEIGSRARVEIAKQFDCRVYLETWVKVRENWTDDERALRSFGYD